MHRILILPEFRQIWKLDTGNPDIFFNITKLFFVKNTEVPQIVRKIETKLFCDSIEEKVLVGQKLGESCKGGGVSYRCWGGGDSKLDSWLQLDLPKNLLSGSRPLPSPTVKPYSAASLCWAQQPPVLQPASALGLQKSPC